MKPEYVAQATYLMRGEEMGNEQVRGATEVPPELRKRLAKLVADFREESDGCLEAEAWCAWQRAADHIEAILEEQR